ncbi:hypothetical protein D3C75_861150 [compost metagenome]
MTYTVLMRFNRSVQHCGMSLHPKLVCGPVNLQIFLYIGFVDTHFFPVLVGQNFCPSASKRLKSGSTQRLQHLPDAQSADSREEINLCRCIGLQSHLRERFVQGLERINIILKGHLIVMAADNMELTHSGMDMLFDILHHFLTGKGIGAFFTVIFAEIAECAVCFADIGEI